MPEEALKPGAMAVAVSRIDWLERTHVILPSIAAAALEPSQHATAGLFEELELNGPICLLLHHDSARADPTATDNIADFDFYDVASAQLAVDGEVEQRAVS